MVDDLSPYEALLHAICLCKTQAGLARVCGVSPTAVWKWLQSTKRLPSDHVIAVSDATGIPPYVLRPDSHPRDYFEERRWIGTDQRAAVVMGYDHGDPRGDRTVISDRPGRILLAGGAS